ncbi:hypothetical protein [Bacillus sp. V33-4]|uniref:hypothetical protein n=1 Tax=Bacillus sp. V33-4 TaxID=2054169 RepID=UPI000C77B1E5|nr:hypothetical protein [Bacillus sp. V33-4]PLR87529.1 hypothetical protein CVD23_02720 [Bacillus sp. V33-4]
MEPNKKGNSSMPDFKELDDRVIGEPTDGPTLVIRTNLDTKDVTEENPYFENKKGQDEQEFRAYFEE